MKQWNQWSCSFSWERGLPRFLKSVKGSLGSKSLGTTGIGNRMVLSVVWKKNMNEFFEGCQNNIIQRTFALWGLWKIYQCVAQETMLLLTYNVHETSTCTAVPTRVIQYWYQDNSV